MTAMQRAAPILTEFLVHRDRDAKAVVIEIQGRRFCSVKRVEPLDQDRLSRLALVCPSKNPAFAVLCSGSGAQLQDLCDTGQH